MTNSITGLGAPRPPSDVDAQALDFYAATDPHAPPPPPPTDHEAVPVLPLSPEFLAHVSAAAKSSAVTQANAARNEEVKSRLDDLVVDFGNAFHGPHGLTQAPPMFRMNGGPNNVPLNAKALAAALPTMTGGEQHAIAMARAGRPTPNELRVATSALLARGFAPPKLDPGETDASRIRHMQWQNGIGVDCAGYVRAAIVKLYGHEALAGFPDAVNDNLVTLPHRPGWKSVAPADLRAGDAIQLRSPTKGEVGHNVIVASANELSAEDRGRMVAKYGDEAVKFFSEPGRVRMLEVDSSFGAEDGLLRGGYRRDVWLFNTNTQEWATICSRPHQGENPFGNLKGPNNGEIFAGAARPARLDLTKAVR